MLRVKVRGSCVSKGSTLQPVLCHPRHDVAHDWNSCLLACLVLPTEHMGLP